MPKKLTIALIVLIDLCSGISLLRVRPAHSCPAKLWNTVQVNVLEAEKRVIQYYQGVRLVYDITRQLQRQENEHAWRPALAPESKLRVTTPSRRIECPLISSSFRFARELARAKHLQKRTD